MLPPLRSRTYRHLFAAQVIALLGTGLATVALGLVTYQLAGPDAGAVLGTPVPSEEVPQVIAVAAQGGRRQIVARQAREERSHPDRLDGVHACRMYCPV